MNWGRCFCLWVSIFGKNVDVCVGNWFRLIVSVWTILFDDLNKGPFFERIICWKEVCFPGPRQTINKVSDFCYNAAAELPQQSKL